MLSNNPSKAKLETISQTDISKVEVPPDVFKRRRSSTGSTCSRSITNAKYMKVKTKLFKYMKEINFQQIFEIKRQMNPQKSSLRAGRCICLLLNAFNYYEKGKKIPYPNVLDPEFKDWESIKNCL